MLDTNETEKTSAVDQEKPETELVVSAAASLTDALEELKGPFEDAHEGITVTYNFGSSGKLATTIEIGAPSDVFLSASSIDMNNMEDKSLIVNESRKDFTENALVLITHNDSDSTISSFEDVDPEAIDHLAVGEPESVPARVAIRKRHLITWISGNHCRTN